MEYFYDTIKIRVKFNSHIPSTLRFCYWRKIRTIYPATEDTKGKVSPSHLVNIFVQQNNNVTQPFSFPCQHLRVISQPFFSSSALDPGDLTPVNHCGRILTLRVAGQRLKCPEGKIQSVFFLCLGNNPKSHFTVIIISASARCASYLIILNWLFNHFILAFVDLNLSRNFFLCITFLQVSGNSSILQSYIKLHGINNILLSRFENIYTCVLNTYMCNKCIYVLIYRSIYTFMNIYVHTCFSIGTHMYTGIWKMHINAFYFVFEYCIFSPYQVVGFWEQIYLRRQEAITLIYMDLRPGEKA